MTMHISVTLSGSENDDVLNFDTYSDADLTGFIYGYGGNDTITVDSWGVPVVIDAGAGNDQILGVEYGAAATVFGGAGNDVVSGYFSSGSTVLDGGDGDDTLRAGGALDAQRIQGFEALALTADITISGRVLQEFKTVNVGANHITFATAADLAGVHFQNIKKSLLLTGSEVGDNFDLSKWSGNYSIFGKEGDDVVIAGSKRLYADGGFGADYLVGSAQGDWLSAGVFDEDASRTVRETVLGGAGDDIIVYAGASGVYDGGEDGDTLQISSTLDRCDLTRSTVTGFETLSFSTNTDVVIGVDFFETIKAIKGVAHLVFADAIEVTDFPSIVGPPPFTGPALVLGGSGSDDIFDLSNLDALVRFNGGGGNDVYHAGGTSVDLTGGTGDDRLYGSTSYDSIQGGAGNDKLYGFDGRDEIYGGSGEDVISGGIGDDFILGGSGADKITGGLGADSIAGGSGNDEIHGGAGADTIYGGGDADTIFGGDGADTIDGGHGKNILHGGVGNDRFYLNDLKLSDSQTLYGDAGNDIFQQNDESSTPVTVPVRLTLAGGGGWDAMYMSGHLEKMIASSIEELRFADEIWARPEFLSGFKSIYGTSESNPDAIIHLTSTGTLTWRSGNVDVDIIGTKGDDVFDFSAASGVFGMIELGAGDDIIRFGRGGAGETGSIDGGSGNDRFYAGKGDDYFFGRAGSDTYVARGNRGIDQFFDFTSIGPEADVIDLRGIQAITGFKDLMKHHLKADDIGEVYIDMGVDGILLLAQLGFNEPLSESNFIF